MRAESRLFGFLFGCVLSGGAVYTYLLQEYKTSNDLLTEDIYVRSRNNNAPLPPLYRSGTCNGYNVTV